jgi:fatty-acyl-CoA synthase
VIDTGSTLRSLLVPHAGGRDEAVAAVIGEQQLTFAALRERSARVAAALHREGVRAGDAVAVWLPNCAAWIDLQFALAHLGALLVCVNTRYRAHELGGVLSQSRARWLVLQPEFRGIDFQAILFEVAPEQHTELQGVVVHGVADKLSSFAGLPAVSYAGLWRGAVEAAASEAGPDQPCVAFASSGSTGVPKLIVHTQRGVADHAQAVGETFFDQPSATGLVTLPLSGVFGYVTLMGALAAGRPSVVMESFDAQRAVDLIERHRVSTITGPDEVMERILKAAQTPERIASWQEGGFGAQSVDSELLIARGDGAGVRLFQCYGSSECLGLTSRQPRDATPSERAVGGGVPVSPLTQVRVRSEAGELLGLREPGLLEIKGPSVMAGYLYQPEATAAAFTDDGWFRTGDIGYLVDPATSRFVFLTRNNDVLRLSGFLVEPLEIEHFIGSLDGVAAVQVVEVRTDRGARAAAFAIPEEGADLLEEAVIEHCAASLAKYKVPVRVFIVNGFPTTPSANGDKVRRARLRELAEALMTQHAEA